MTVPAVPTVQLSEASTTKGANTAAAAAQAMPAAPNQEADPALANTFDAQRFGQSAEPAATGTVHMHRAGHEAHNFDAMIDKVRKETAALDARYESAMQQMEHPAALLDTGGDPAMAMVKMLDFTLTTSATMQQYQFSMTVADASNGVTHSLLKTDPQ